MKAEPFTRPPNPFLKIQWQDDRVELVCLPAVLYVAGLIRRDVEILGWANTFWALGFGIWCAWTLWRVTDRFPRDDTWRAVATLVYGGAPWLLALPLAFEPAVWGPAVAFPLAFVPNLWSLVAARRKYQPPHPRRALFLSGAGMICAVWAALTGWAVWFAVTSPNPQDAFYGWIAAPVLALNLFLATQLFRSAMRGFTPGSSITAASLLAEATPDSQSP